MCEDACFLHILTAKGGELGIYHYWGELLASDMNNVLMVASRILRPLLPFLNSIFHFDAHCRLKCAVAA
jgi:hypothetical protein